MFGSLLENLDLTSMWPLFVLGGLLLVVLLVNYMNELRKDIEATKQNTRQFLSQSVVLNMMHQVQLDTLKRVHQSFGTAVESLDINTVDKSLARLVVRYNQELEQQIKMIQSDQEKRAPSVELDF